MYDIGSNHTQIRLIDNVDRFSYETWPLQHFKVWQISQILTSMWYAFRRCMKLAAHKITGYSKSKF